MQITVKASRRTEQGSRASRRLRRAGRVPGIVYGGDKAPQPITLDHNELYHQLNNEAFHASILTLEIDGERESVLLRDTQWHAYKPLVLHVDFQRVSADEKIHLNVPLHFVGGENSPAVKLGGCIISHVLTEIEVRCLPKDLPEYITVDLSNMQPEQSLHLSQLELPPGVEAVHHGEGDPVVATALKVRGESGPEGGETTES